MRATATRTFCACPRFTLSSLSFGSGRDAVDSTRRGDAFFTARTALYVDNHST